MSKFDEAFDLPADPPKNITDVFVPPQENSEEDFKYARQNLYSVIELASASLDDLAKLAKTAQNARMYEVLANMVKTTLEANKDLLDLQKKRKDLQQGGVPGSTGPTTVNNNLYMTTAEFQRFIEKQTKKPDDRTPEG